MRGPEIDKYGNLYWRNEKGQLHREDGPALITSRGDCHWYINGELHRKDGPALDRTNGNKEWYINGKLHREDGPAVEYTDGEKEWWVDGKLVKDNKTQNLCLGPKPERFCNNA